MTDTKISKRNLQCYRAARWLIEKNDAVESGSHSVGAASEQQKMMNTFDQNLSARHNEIACLNIIIYTFNNVLFWT